MRVLQLFKPALRCQPIRPAYPNCERVAIALALAGAVVLGCAHGHPRFCRRRGR